MPDDDPKVKDLLDDATRADLERWFGLPSFQQLADEGKPAAPPVEEDPDDKARREQREQTLAAVDARMVDRHIHRYEVEPESLIRFRAVLELRVDPSLSNVDQALIDRRHSIAEPREVEISYEIHDDLKECTPQALLRDLHRPEVDFEKVFEVVDVVAEQRVDGSAVVAEVMATRWRTTSFDASPAAEGRAIMNEFHRDRRQPIASILGQLWNRRVED